MKRLVLFALAATVISSTGCGQRSAITPGAVAFTSQQALPQEESRAPLDASKAPVPQPVVANSPLDRLAADLRSVALHGPVIQNLETLGADIDEQPGYGVLASVDSTQPKAIKQALEWAPDAEQIYLGWGFKWLTFAGHSRHVFWSPTKKKLLTLNYGFWGSLKDQSESENLAMKYGGAIIRQLLREPSDRHEFDGKAAFQRAKNAGLEAPSHDAIKAILVDAYFLGPVWIFFDYRNQPAMLVDANDGRVISDSYMIDILKYLF